MMGAKLAARFVAWDLGPPYRNQHKGLWLKRALRRRLRAQERREAVRLAHEELRQLQAGEQEGR